jgi:hypothetical protein
MASGNQAIDDTPQAFGSLDVPSSILLDTRPFTSSSHQLGERVLYQTPIPAATGLGSISTRVSELRVVWWRRYISRLALLAKVTFGIFSHSSISGKLRRESLAIQINLNHWM